MFTDPEKVAGAVASSFGGARILVVGDLMLDRYLAGRVERISPEAPVPIVRVVRQSESPGGAGNVALNLAKLGLRVSAAGFIGPDSQGASVRRLLEESGIQHQAIVTCQRCPTTTKARVIGGHQQMLRLDIEDHSEIQGCERCELLRALTRELEAPCTVMLLSDYGKGVLDEQLCQLLIRKARATDTPIIVDPKGRDYGKYAGATLLSPNRAELALATGTSPEDLESLRREGERLRRKLKLEMLALTMSEHGITLFDASGVRHFPALAREVFDVSGAGDTVIATIAAAFAAGLDRTDAMRLANLAAGIVVGKVGTVAVTRVELLDAVNIDSVFEQAHKVASLETAMERVAGWRHKGERIVFTNGCFDLLHIGHVKLLDRAKREGSRLIVGLNSDSSVRRLKGPSRPIVPQADRARILAALSSVDLVVLFDEQTPLKLINALRPHVLVKGSDYRIDQIAGANEVRSWGGRVVLVPLVQGSSTSNILKEIGQVAGQPRLSKKPMRRRS